MLKLPSIQDFDQRDFVKYVSNRCDFSNFESSSESNDSAEITGEESMNWMETAAFIAAILPVGIAYGIANGLTGGRLWHDMSKDDARKMIDEMRYSFDAAPLLNNIIKGKDKVVSEVKKSFIDELLSPLQNQLDEVRQEGINKEQKLEEAKDKLELLQKRNSELSKQIEVLSPFVN